MKKTTFTLLSLILMPSLSLASSFDPEEVTRGLMDALTQGNAEQVEFWLSLQETLPSSKSMREDVLRRQQEEEALTLAFLQEEEARETALFQANLERLHLEEEALTLAYLQEEQKKSHAQPRFTQDDRIAINAMLELCAAYDDKDVHLFNKQVVVPNLQTLLTMGNRVLKPLTTTAYGEIFTQMRHILALDGDLYQTEPAISKLASHLASTHTDLETGIHVPTLLSSLWDIATRFPHHRFQSGHNSFVATSPQRMIVHISMPEGLRTEGGCFPGYAGRFFRDYLTLLHVISLNS